MSGSENESTSLPVAKSYKDSVPAMDAAAASLLTEGGVAALTFRAVAGRAGATLGQTAYYFGSKTQLLGAAFDTLYQQIANLQQDMRRLNVSSHIKHPQG